MRSLLIYLTVSCRSFVKRIISAVAWQAVTLVAAGCILAICYGEETQSLLCIVVTPLKYSFKELGCHIATTMPSTEIQDLLHRSMKDSSCILKAGPIKPKCCINSDPDVVHFLRSFGGLHRLPSDTTGIRIAAFKQLEQQSDNMHPAKERHHSTHITRGFGEHHQQF